MAEEAPSIDTGVGERRKGERRDKEENRALQAQFEIPTIILNTGFILLIQIIVIFAFCN
jgi:hypothetical protein